ncbi:hypothetical protein [Thiofilum flexile]|uniref:hypothetical protein n=1 Tax=Thiofilum flexile TaxID=125627 RepID=UPI0003646653|nr:hypothetical protein [Thiofilum flexile]
MNMKPDMSLFELVVIWLCKVAGWGLIGFLSMSSLLFVAFFVLHVVIPAIRSIFT